MLDWVKFWLQNSIYQVQWKVVYKVINSNKSVGNLEPKIRNILGSYIVINFERVKNLIRIFWAINVTFVVQ